MQVRKVQSLLAPVQLPIITPSIPLHSTASFAGLKPRKMQTLAVIGGGLMGSGIATALVLNGLDVILKEVRQLCLHYVAPLQIKRTAAHPCTRQTRPPSLGSHAPLSSPPLPLLLPAQVNQQFLDGGMTRIKSNLASRVKKGAMTQAQADAALARVKGALDYADFKR